MKTCTKCEQPGQFYKGFRWCKICCRVYNSSPERRAAQKAARNKPATAAARAAYKEKNEKHFVRIGAEARLKKLYGVDYEDLARLFEKQSGCCALCDMRLKFDRGTHVDHCHSTGKVRGLLCAACNLALGHIEKPGQLDRMLAYLRATYLWKER